MTRVAGIDVSHWQFEIDWPAVRAAGVRFAFIKATEGNFNDDFFAANWPAAKAAGILRGPYHFYRPDVDALVQARFFLNAISLEPQDLPPAIDLEIHPNVSGKFYANPALLRGIQACVNMVADQTGQKLVIYTNLSFTKAFLAVSGGAVPGWLKEHTLWIANYNDQDDPNTHESWTNWKFWQYSKAGQHPGVPKNLVDLDWFNGSLDDLGQFAGASLRQDPQTQVVVEGGVATTIVTPPPAPPDDAGVYVVVAGDTLVSIARQFGVTPGELARANLQLAPAGTVLKFPGGSASVQAGESLKDFAVRLNLNLPDVLRLNPQLIKAGMKLNLPGSRPVGGAFIETPVDPVLEAVPAGGSPAAAAAGAGPRPAFTYTIRDGDNLSFIAARFNISLEELEAANPMQNFDLIFPGQKLTVPAESGG